MTIAAVTSAFKSKGTPARSSAASHDLIEDPKDTLTRWGQGFLDAITPTPPAYESLSAQDQADIHQGGSQSVPMAPITDPEGVHHEPVNIEVTGSQQQLEQDLESQGWKIGFTDGQSPGVFGKIASGNIAGLVPFSRENAVDNAGQTVAPSFVMAKDSTGLNRHHMRVYDLGQQDGQTEWGIASSRDDHPDFAVNKGIQLTHTSDPHVDGEQDTVLHDLMAAQRQRGLTPDVTVLKGQPDDATAQPVGNGQYDVNNGEYYSALNVYQLNLAG